jgi:hypothetical protein
LQEPGANRLDSSRRPTCCTTQLRPTNTRLLRKSWSGQTPDHRSSNTIRQASPVCRRNWMASSEHLRVFIGNHITREPSGALRSQQPACRENFGSPTPRVTQPPGIFGCPPGHLRTPTGHLRTPTGVLGLHRNLRVPPDLRVHRVPSGARPAASHPREPSGARRTKFAVARTTSVVHRAV